MNKLSIMLGIAVVGLGATALFAHDRALLLPQPNQVAPAAAWTASNADAATAGVDQVGLGTGPVRRVVVSGFHPLQGFEAETAAERSALANAAGEAAPKDLPLR